MPMLSREDDVEAGTVPDRDRRPTIVAAPASVSPELSGRPRRRTFTARDKLGILAATDRAAETGGIGAILRREGIYSSTLCDWRRQRGAGTFGALTPVKRGPKIAEPNPLAAENASLRENNDRLARCLARAEAIIAVQKKLADLLGIPMKPDGGVP
jgi:transposase